MLQEIVEKDKPPPKPERRISLKTGIVENIIAESLQQISLKNEEDIKSPQRDVRSSRSVEKKLKHESSLNK